MIPSFRLLLPAIILASTAAFIPIVPSYERPTTNTHAIPDALATVANNMWIATIDADIDNIPENEFATVFAGGIVSEIGRGVSV